MSRPHRYILGINSVYHHSSAALIADGKIVAAVEEERFNRIRHAKAAVVDNTPILPFESIDFCLREAGIDFSQVDAIGYSFSVEERRAQQDYLLAYGPVLTGGYKTPEGEKRFRRFNLMVPSLLAARYNLPEDEVRARFHYLDHHLCHLASAYYASPFDEAAVLTIDGIGEVETTTMAEGRGCELTVLESINYPHSLGFVWELLTTFLGFEGNYDECKVMGLASYGDPSVYRDAMSEIVKIREDGTFLVENLDKKLLEGDFSCLEKIFGVRRRVPYEPVRYEGDDKTHAHVAAALQKTTEEVMLGLSRDLHTKTGHEYLTMAGGVTLNCVANGVIARESPFADVWVQPAAHDGGTALGAALHLYHNQKINGAVESVPRCRMDTVYLGPKYSQEETLAVVRGYGLRYREVQDPAKLAAEMIARGKVVGWFDGRMEFGPRALGNRSLLADPRNPQMRDRINSSVKHRAAFRPFCPTLLESRAREWLDLPNVPVSSADAMLVTYNMRKEKIHEVPAVVHVDGSSRIQILRESDNPAFFKLIQEFEKLTGVPLVLNTSFNDREPIVCSPEDGCLCFLKTEIDAVFLGNILVEGPKPWERDTWRRSFDDEIEEFKALSRPA